MINGQTLRIWELVAEYAGSHDLPVTLGVIVAACVRQVRMTGAWVSRGAAPAESTLVTDELAERLEELQFTLGEGPAIDADHMGQQVLVTELAAAEGRRTWPAFASAATRLGVTTVLASPMRVGAAKVGMLGLYSLAPAVLDPAERADVATFAELALGLVLDGHGEVPEDTDRWLHEGQALARAEVHQATGIVAVQLGVTVTEALVRLRAHAFSTGGSLIEVARRVVHRQLRFTPEMFRDR